MAEKLSKISLPNAAGTLTTYDIKDRDAADVRITEDEIDALFPASTNEQEVNE